MALNYNYDLTGAMGGLFAPPHIYGNQAAMDAAAAWNLRNLRTRPTDSWASTATQDQPTDIKSTIADALVQQQGGTGSTDAGGGSEGGGGGYSGGVSMGDYGSTGQNASQTATQDTNTSLSVPLDLSPPSTVTDTTSPTSTTRGGLSVDQQGGRENTVTVNPHPGYQETQQPYNPDYDHNVTVFEQDELTPIDELAPNQSTQVATSVTAPTAVAAPTSVDTPTPTTAPSFGHNSGMVGFSTMNDVVADLTNNIGLGYGSSALGLGPNGTTLDANDFSNVATDQDMENAAASTFGSGLSSGVNSIDSTGRGGGYGIAGLSDVTNDFGMGYGGGLLGGYGYGDVNASGVGFGLGSGLDNASIGNTGIATSDYGMDSNFGSDNTGGYGTNSGYGFGSGSGFGGSSDIADATTGIATGLDTGDSSGFGGGGQSIGDGFSVDSIGSQTGMGYGGGGLGGYGSDGFGDVSTGDMSIGLGDAGIGLGGGDAW